MSKQFRQGDVYLEEIEALPPDASPVSGPIILAHGEATGHAHTIKSRSANLFETPDRDRFLKVIDRPATLRHQEHEAITVPPGMYRVRQQREYSPKEIRRVQD